jgi:alcohol dehydrogenase class IV
MGLSFRLAPTPNIIFGIGKIKTLPEQIGNLGRRTLIVTGQKSFCNTAIGTEFFSELDFMGIPYQIESISGEPSPEQINNIVSKHRVPMPEVIVAIGGGSVLDAGKAISAMLTVDGRIETYLEDVGKLQHPGTKIPFIGVPTTAGTGSEATSNAVITCTQANCFKKSLRHENFVPNLALVDPQLTFTLPPVQTATTGMDTFTQLLEAYLSTTNNAHTDLLALEGISRVIANLQTAYRNGTDGAARSAMSYASLLSGITLSSAGLGLVHGFAQPLGCLFQIPHGIVCSILMKPVNQATITKIFRKESSTTMLKYEKIGRLIKPKSSGFEAINNFLAFLDELNHEFKIPKLGDYGIVESQFSKIIERTSHKMHPVHFSETELREILLRSL